MTTYDWEPHYGFGETNPVRLASALEAVRRRICAYGPDAIRCDCKYGLGDSLTEAQPSTRITWAGSEMTGCPELRSAIRLLLHREDTDALQIDPREQP